MEMSTSFLMRVKGALVQAVTGEDGLDGGIAADLLDEINIALGLGERDYTDPCQPQPNNSLQPTGAECAPAGELE